jgi:hypothetical protein
MSTPTTPRNTSVLAAIVNLSDRFASQEARLRELGERQESLVACVGKLAHTLDKVAGTVSLIQIAHNVDAKTGTGKSAKTDKGPADDSGVDKRAKAAPASVVAKASGLRLQPPKAWVCACGASLPWFFTRCTHVVVEGKGKKATSRVCGAVRPTVEAALAAQAVAVAAKAS